MMNWTILNITPYKRYGSLWNAALLNTKQMAVHGIIYSSIYNTYKMAQRSS